MAELEHSELEPPNAKRRKTDNLEDTGKIFKDFLKNEEIKLISLRAAFNSCVTPGGLTPLKLCLMKLEETNARISEGFSRACCNVTLYKKADPPFIVVRTYCIGAIFKAGLIILRTFLDCGKVPVDAKQREALRRLLTFLTVDHQALFEVENCDKVQWAVRVAQHLLLPLSVAKNYTIDASYEGLSNYENICPCDEGDTFIGEIGDTSFGLVDGWHGRTDILVNDVTVDLGNFDSSVADEDLEIGSSVSSSLSSTEVKTTEGFSEKDKQKIIAQTIVFSFLQHKESEGDVKNCLIPGIGISKGNVISYFYDCEADVLLGTPLIDLQGYNTLSCDTIVFLWLTLNHKIFCSGITDSMKGYKAEFVERAGDFIEKYRNDVTRNVRESKQKESEKECAWGKSPPTELLALDKTGEDHGIHFMVP